MNIIELYQKVPTERHHEIVVTGDRLFYDEEEYFIDLEGNLVLIHSHKRLENRLETLVQKQVTM